MPGEAYVADRDARIRIRRELILTSGGKPVTGYTVDLSVHGFSAIASHPFDQGARVSVGLYLDMEKTQCVVSEGEITWVEGEDRSRAAEIEAGTPALKSRLGVRFATFREGDEEVLRQFLRSKGVELS